LAALFLYNWAVALFDAPTPASPWDLVLAVVWTALFLPWLVLAARDAWRRWRFVKLS
jgi:hypothetical protein